MAALAVLLKDWEHVAVESGDAYRLIRGRGMLSSVADQDACDGAGSKDEYLNAVAWR
jgi:hypothetical protein